MSETRGFSFRGPRNLRVTEAATSRMSLCNIYASEDKARRIHWGCIVSIWRFPMNGGTPIAGWFISWKIPSRNGWELGVPPFQETSIWLVVIDSGRNMSWSTATLWHLHDIYYIYSCLSGFSPFRCFGWHHDDRKTRSFQCPTGMPRLRITDTWRCCGKESPWVKPPLNTKESLYHWDQILGECLIWIGDGVTLNGTAPIYTWSFYMFSWNVGVFRRHFKFDLRDP